MNKKNTSAFVGLSHLGLVTSFVWTNLDPNVIGIDDDKKLINNLNNNTLPIYEPGLDKLFGQIHNNYLPTTDFSQLKKIPLVFFTQDTETDGRGSVEKLNKLIEKSIPFLKQNASLVLMSQVPVGFCRHLEMRIKNRRPNLKFNLYHWIDTIIMTQAIDCFLNPERIIIGSSIPSKKIHPLLKNKLTLFKCPKFLMSFESAEITKAAINLYLANSITYANTLSDYCEITGANVHEIIPALQTDKRIGHFSYIYPGLRISGGHLERDLNMLKKLADRNKISSGVVNWILKSNEKRYLWVKDKLDNLKIKPNSVICIWGLAYKKGSTSTENAPSTLLIKKLSKNYILHVYDPMANLPKQLSGYKRFQDKYAPLKNSDCLIILTDWGEFENADINKMSKLMRNKIIIDCPAIFHSKKKKLNKFKYTTLGLP